MAFGPNVASGVIGDNTFGTVGGKESHCCSICAGLADFRGTRCRLPRLLRQLRLIQHPQESPCFPFLSKLTELHFVALNSPHLVCLSTSQLSADVCDCHECDPFGVCVLAQPPPSLSSCEQPPTCLPSPAARWSAASSSCPSCSSRLCGTCSCTAPLRTGSSTAVDGANTALRSAAWGCPSEARRAPPSLHLPAPRLSVYGAVDFAGGLVVHTSSGVAAFVLAFWLGRRADAASASEAASNVPFVILGTALLWFGAWGGRLHPTWAQALLVSCLAWRRLVWLQRRQCPGRKLRRGAVLYKHTGAFARLTLLPVRGRDSPPPPFEHSAAGRCRCRDGGVVRL